MSLAKWVAMKWVTSHPESLQTVDDMSIRFAAVILWDNSNGYHKLKAGDWKNVTLHEISSEVSMAKYFSNPLSKETKNWSLECFYTEPEQKT